VAEEQTEPKQPPALPLDDPRWIPVVVAHKSRWEATGDDPRIVAVDLTAALRDGLPCMRRDLRGEREWVPSTHWEKWELQYWSSDQRLLVCRPVLRRGGGGGQIIPDPRVYYVWRPAFDVLRGEQEPPVPAAGEEVPPGKARRGGRREGAGSKKTISLTDHKRVHRVWLALLKDKPNASVSDLRTRLRVAKPPDPAAGWNDYQLRTYGISSPPKTPRKPRR
jgi:hypothetical protein